ncbi:hypothetical protein BACCAP_04002 [Pseudoflavonifractor capillosus ATCC 29799]|uniref:Uncharacterized protein n=1 Tax=Pseudoflavonifractor capillosus ATCC 29799 TaxID=411467 RepID=A6P0J0_9FIRM|nr:hypothetical protein BACCAP_04002 [Pseudoflavonifractor capillosus ATCC 29799]
MATGSAAHSHRRRFFPVDFVCIYTHQSFIGQGSHLIGLYIKFRDLKMGERP